MATIPPVGIGFEWAPIKPDRVGVLLAGQDRVVSRSGQASMERIERGQLGLVQKGRRGEHGVLVVGRPDRNELQQVGDRPGTSVS